MNKTKKEDFTRLLKYRSTKLFKRLKSIQNLAGPSYENEPWQVERFFEALDKEVAELKAEFSDEPASDELDLDTPPDPEEEPSDAECNED